MLAVPATAKFSLHWMLTQHLALVQACVHSLQQALECCQKIGYPVMLKASWGGGGKGIRKCMNDDDVRASYKQVMLQMHKSRGTTVFAANVSVT